MKKKIKDKWVKALKSGKYKKTVNQLKKGDKCFCVLGVLTDLYAKEKKCNWIKEDGHGQYISCDSQKNTDLPPTRVLKWAGLKMNTHLEFEIPDYENEKSKVDLITLNDDWRLSFKKMAKMIEEQL